MSIMMALEESRNHSISRLCPRDKMKQLDLEMQRLAVAALGMYNRRKLHILSSELNEDIKFFDLERSISVSSGRSMTEADLLLGSFFFVHRSKAQIKAGTPEHHEEAAAFEFLHNTFGEFLTAEFIIRQAVTEIAALKRLNEDDDLRLEHDKRLSVADGLSKAWFASLVYTPLFTRPVVLEMMREWMGHALESKKITKSEFLSHLDMIIVNQIKRLLSKKEMPSIIRGETAQEGYRTPFGDHPLLGHIAIYSINLILLRIIVADEPFVFDENQIGTFEDGARPWDRLTYVWRSWFALENLNGVAAVMFADRRDSQITVQAKEKFQVAESQGRLETCLNVAISLGDNISSGIVGLLMFEPSENNHLGIEEIARRLESERIIMEFQIAMNRMLLNEPRVNIENSKAYAIDVRKTLEMALILDKRRELEYIALSFRQAVKRLRQEKFVEMRSICETPDISMLMEISPTLAVDVTLQNRQAGLIFFRLAKEISFEKWITAFLGRLIDSALDKFDSNEMGERDPEAWMDWLQLAQETGTWRFHEISSRKLLNRMFFFKPEKNLSHLLGLNERNPEAALALVQLARKIKGEGFLHRLSSSFFKACINSSDLLELNERNPEAALAWVQLAREIEGESFLQRMNSKFLEHVFNPLNLLELKKRNPEVALAWVKLACDIKGEIFLRQIIPEFFDGVFYLRDILGLDERNPKAALAWVQLAREVEGKGILQHIDPELFDGAFHARDLLELNERNPEAGLAWVQLASDAGYKSILAQNGDEVIDRWSKKVGSVQILQREPKTIAVPIRLARITESQEAIEKVLECMTLLLRVPEREQISLEMLSLASYGDLRWLAKKTANIELDSALDRLS